MCVDCQVDPFIDCSDEAQAKRKQQISDLRDMLVSVISNVSDRGRSVSYNRAEIRPVLNELMAEQYYCLYGEFPSTSGRRLVGPPVIWKGL